MNFNELAVRITHGDTFDSDYQDKIRVYDWKATNGLQLGINLSRFRGHPLTVGELRKILDDLEKYPLSGIIMPVSKES